MTNRGVCRNPSCENGRTKKLVEVYPGPGEYCPECGDLLEALTPLEALATFDPPSWTAPPEPPQKRGSRPVSLVLSAIVLAVGMGAVATIARVASHDDVSQTSTVPHRFSHAHAATRSGTRAALHRVAPATAETQSTPAATDAMASPTPDPTKRPTLRPHPTPRPKILSSRKPSHAANTQPGDSTIAGSHDDPDPRLAVQLASASVDGLQTLAPVPRIRSEASPATPTTTPAAARTAETPTAPSATPTPASCTRPDTPATMVRPALAETPRMAQEMAISGTVQVLVSLDAQSRVVRARVQSSPSSVLNIAALTAARNSQFRTQIKNCEAIATDYVLNVSFQ